VSSRPAVLRSSRLWRAALCATVLTTLAGSGVSAGDGCSGPTSPVTVDDLVSRIEEGRLRYAFVGERHGIGPVKRFVVDLANALVDRGHDVGVYVEGYRVGCDLDDPSCNRLASAFNPEAYRALVGASKALVHPIDPDSAGDRARRMAETVAAGSEEIRVVLVGASHVLFATDPEGEVPIFGGALRYPDPGDVAEAFPRGSYLTVGLRTVDRLEAGYAVRSGGCGSDYTVETERTGRF